MIDLFQAVVLAFIQGLTEFLPVSSSGHLVFPSLLLGWPDQGLAFDVAVHVGTLAAVLYYYRHDLLVMAEDFVRNPLAGRETAQSYMVWYIAAASVPVVLLGALAGSFIEASARSLPVIASTTIVFGLLLGLADRRASSGPAGDTLSLQQALLIGCAQAVALIPGVSRSGITITAGLFLGLNRQTAARFSFLLSIPAIGGAGLLKTWDLLTAGEPSPWWQMAVGTLVSGLVAYSCIAVFLRLLDRIGMAPFVWYRVVLGVLLFWVWLR